jgi:hypothetical protein
VTGGYRVQRDMDGGAPTGVSPDPLADLMNDADALSVLVRLAEYGLECCEKFNARIGTPGERQADYPAAVTVARLFDNGAGGYEADAVVAWVRDRLNETENTVAAMDGSGAPFSPSHGFAYLLQEIEGVMRTHDLSSRDDAILQCAASVLRSRGDWEVKV